MLSTGILVAGAQQGGSEPGPSLSASAFLLATLLLRWQRPVFKRGCSPSDFLAFSSHSSQTLLNKAKNLSISFSPSSHLLSSPRPRVGFSRSLGLVVVFLPLVSLPPSLLPSLSTSLSHLRVQFFSDFLQWEGAQMVVLCLPAPRTCESGSLGPAAGPLVVLVWTGKKRRGRPFWIIISWVLIN